MSVSARHPFELCRNKKLLHSLFEKAKRVCNKTSKFISRFKEHFQPIVQKISNSEAFQEPNALQQSNQPLNPDEQENFDSDSNDDDNEDEDDKKYEKSVDDDESYNTEENSEDIDMLAEQMDKIADEFETNKNENNPFTKQEQNNPKNNSMFGSFQDDYNPNGETNVINITFNNNETDNNQPTQPNIRKTSEFGGFIETPQTRNATPYPQPSQTQQQTQQPQVQYYQMSNKRSQNQNENKMVGTPGFFANTLN